MSASNTPTPSDETPQPELYSRASIDRLVARFQRRFPSFDSQDYQNEERFYKDAFAKRLRELLSREALGKQIAAGEFEAAKAAVMQACGGSVVTPTGYRQANNLLNQWDRLPILNAPAEEVARRMYDLLHGDGPFDARFEAWVELLARDKPGVWAPATYFLMLHDPAEHLMVKPSQWQLFLKEASVNLAWSTRPSAMVYSWIRSIARQLRSDLAPLGARDMIDVQSFLWRITPAADDMEDDTMGVPEGDTLVINGGMLDSPLSEKPSSDEHGITGVEAGLSGRDQIRIGLQAIVDHGGSVTIQQIYSAVEARLGGQRLSPAGQSSLRFFINSVAVKAGYVYPYNRANPGWRITPQGEQFLQLSSVEQQVALPAIPENEAEQQSGDAETPMLPLPPTRQPTLYTDVETQYWRIHFPRERWSLARRHGVIAVGWPLDSTNQSVKRFQRIKAGDRVVAYVQGGMVGGVGTVTHPFEPDNPRAGIPAEVTGEDFNQCVRVAWADSPAEPADLGAALRHPLYTPLYNKVKNLNTVVPLQPDDYATLLSLLQVDDPQPSGANSRLPSAWSQLGDFVGFARGLGPNALDAEAILAAARGATPPAGALQDAEELVAELLQLRLLVPADGKHYQAQPYVSGDLGALLRLCALALLVPVKGTTDEYTLPARVIVPQMLQASGDQRPDRFAPELGGDGLTLLRWYAEAGLVQMSDGEWQLAPDALAPLPGTDPASAMYNLLVDTLRAEQAGQLPTDLPPVTDDTPLRAVADLDARLHELGEELLIDAAVVRRIYRSLMAGRHVVLSGPPGTGKTELARRLPSLLWREDRQIFRRISLRPERPPVSEAGEQRHGYAPIVVTATEDWGVRDVVGGIGPRLDGQSGTISYTIEHGALTRVVLQHYAGTEGGRRLPPAGASMERRDYRDEDGQRYRGAWLVIDEFTRAPVDAAFGSLLTTLSGGEQARLAVPTPSGEPRELPLPRDFRIIGTLNSFDRHFLNQMSEAMKRRFDFIDVLPPGPADGLFEQGVAAMQALRRLHRNGFDQIAADSDGSSAWRWPGVLAAEPTTDAAGLRRYRAQAEHAEAAAALDSFWRLFSAIRVFRQLGTAQIVAVYSNLLAGALVGMAWAEALDTALADGLADQLQVLARDEQRTVDAVVEHAGSPADFVNALRAIMRELPPGRRAGYLHALRERDAAASGASDIGVREDAQLSDAQILRIFAVDAPLTVPKLGVFRRRLRDLIGERGL